MNRNGAMIAVGANVLHSGTHVRGARLVSWLSYIG